ncbi:MAG: hypothetical protein IJP78_07900 [Clostridia bacterium]|nr:hypothetical protein [Clostridia bacterium]
MAQRITYTAVNWKNRVVQRPRTYTETTNQDGSRTDTPAPGTVVQAGTPINQANLGKMEKGIADCVEAINELDSQNTTDANTMRDFNTRIQNNERAIRDIQDVNEEQSAAIHELKEWEGLDYFETIENAFHGIAVPPDAAGTFIGNGNATITVNGYTRQGQYIDVGFSPSKVAIFVITGDVAAGMSESGLLSLEAGALLKQIKCALIAPGKNYYHSGCGSTYLTSTPQDLLNRGHGGAAVYNTGFVVQYYSGMGVNERSVRYLYHAWR